ncbi:hypothetical protein [Metabacillus fastidiosus]|uniref:Uncharacterized protein n=1 Tax=Metabacillus fastidiosus TaxID=1458 RepID=A0ABU6NRP4_9BACI|nr:hypothetical protein [Metabacillus fastidiosus]
MKITVNEQPQRFYLAFDKWEAAVGHEITVGEYRFCAIPLSKTVNISEVTSGAKVLDIPISFEMMMVTATKEGSMEFFKKIGKRLEQAIIRKNDFDQQLTKMKETAFERLGEMPPIETVEID